MFKSKYTGEEIEEILDSAKTPYMLPVASSNTLGGVKTNYTQSGKNYPVKVDNNGNAYVYVPWTDANTTYGVASTSANGLMPKLPKLNIVTGGNSITPAMQVLTGDGQYKALNLGYNDIINKLTLGFYNSSTGFGSVGATIPIATSTADGLMSKDDKTKLDGFHSVMDNHGSYILTEAGIPGAYYWNDTDNQMEFMANDVPGNWLSEDGWEYSNNNIFVLPNIPTATTTTGGVMSPEDKSKLDGGVLAAVWDLRGKDASTSAAWSGLDVTPLINEHRPLVLIMDNGNYVETIPASYRVGSTIYLWYRTSKTVDNNTTYVLKEVHLWYESSNNKVSFAQIKEITG